MRYFKKVEDWFFVPKFVFCAGLILVEILFGILASLASLGHFAFGDWLDDTCDTIDRIMG